MVESTKTRSGRISKKPKNYEPDEIPEDDFLEDEYDDDYEECVDDEDFSESDSGELTDDEDVDDNGNLKDFIVDDDSESGEED